MAIKWNKKICIDAIVNLKSPFEESQPGVNGNKPRLPQMVEKLRQMAAKQPRR